MRCSSGVTHYIAHKAGGDDWLRTDFAQRFIRAYAVTNNLVTGDLVIVRRGNFKNQPQGTWIVKDVAIEYARWQNHLEKYLRSG
jgi:hypothetical protein